MRSRLSLQETTLQRNVNFVGLLSLTEQLGAEPNFSSVQRRRSYGGPGLPVTTPPPPPLLREPFFK